MALSSTTASDELPLPVCQVCFKILPASWAGIDRCPMCIYDQRVREARQPRCTRPSYHSPLAHVETMTDAY